MQGKITIYSDGGSRGNPGPAACAFVVIKDKNILHKEAYFLGKTTNNVAEYKGVLFALGWLKENKNLIEEKTVQFFLDSELVVKQLTGVYKVKNNILKNLFILIKQNEKSLNRQIFYKHIYREKNKLADSLLNNKLDSRKK